MNSPLQLLDVVALADDFPARKLPRGQVGTVVETLSNGFFEIEFADDTGRAYAFAALPADALIKLHFEPATATAA